MLLKRLPREWRFLALPLFVAACGTAQQVPKNAPSAGLIATPAAYYTSPKAKYLGTKYKDNLDRLADRIVRNAKTANLQFANNIASVGGIGFFTHSAAKLSDERFLEVILGAPDAFETRGDMSAKLFRLFGVYGTELLAILASDSAIYEEKDVSGYGLNLTWRSMLRDPAGAGRVTVERAVVYFQKDRVREFLRHELTQNQLLGDAVIFAAEESGPMALVSYRTQSSQADSRPPIQDETLAGSRTEALPRHAADAAREPRPTPRPIQADAAKPDRLVQSGAAASAEKSMAKNPAVGEKPPSPSSKAPTPAPAEKQRTETVVEKQSSAALQKNQPEPPAVRKQPLQSPASAQTAAQVQGAIRPEKSSGRATAGDLPSVEKKPSETGPQKKPEEMATAQKAAAKLPAPEQTASPVMPVSQQNLSKPTQAAIAPTASKPSADAALLNTKAAALSGKEPAPAASGPAATSVKTPAENASEAYAKHGSGSARSKPSDAGDKKSENMTPPKKAAAAGATQLADTTSTVTADTNQLALLKGKTSEKSTPETHSAAVLSRRPLEAYVIQVRFDSRADAQRWAETIERRGYPVSLTEAGAASVRLRFGNFPLREDAERQLGALKKEGLTGIIVNLPGGYRQDAGAHPAAANRAAD